MKYERHHEKEYCISHRGPVVGGKYSFTGVLLKHFRPHITVDNRNYVYPTNIPTNTRFCTDFIVIHPTISPGSV